MPIKNCPACSRPMNADLATCPWCGKPSANRPQAAAAPTTPDMMPCPFCQEPIRRDAMSCRWCGEAITTAAGAGPGAAPIGPPAWPQQPLAPPPPHLSPPPLMPHPPAAPSGTLPFVLSLIGLGGGFLCLFPFMISPVAWFLARNYEKQCRTMGIPPDGLGTAGKILAIIGTVFLFLCGGFVTLGIVLSATGVVK